MNVSNILKNLKKVLSDSVSGVNFHNFFPLWRSSRVGGGNLEQGGIHYRSRGSRRNERRSFFSRMPLEYINPGLTVFLFSVSFDLKRRVSGKKMHFNTVKNILF